MVVAVSLKNFPDFRWIKKKSYSKSDGNNFVLIFYRDNSTKKQALIVKKNSWQWEGIFPRALNYYLFINNSVYISSVHLGGVKSCF